MTQVYIHCKSSISISIKHTVHQSAFSLHTDPDIKFDASLGSGVHGFVIIGAAAVVIGCTYKCLKLSFQIGKDK